METSQVSVGSNAFWQNEWVSHLKNDLSVISQELFTDLHQRVYAEAKSSREEYLKLFRHGLAAIPRWHPDYLNGQIDVLVSRRSYFLSLYKYVQNAYLTMLCNDRGWKCDVSRLPETDVRAFLHAFFNYLASSPDLVNATFLNQDAVKREITMINSIRAGLTTALKPILMNLEASQETSRQSAESRRPNKKLKQAPSSPKSDDTSSSSDRSPPVSPIASPVASSVSRADAKSDFEVVRLNADGTRDSESAVDGKKIQTTASVVGSMRSAVKNTPVVPHPTPSKSVVGQSAPVVPHPTPSKSLVGPSAPVVPHPTPSKSLVGQSAPVVPHPTPSKSLVGQSAPVAPHPTPSKSLVGQGAPVVPHPTPSKSVVGQSAPVAPHPTPSKSLVGQSAPVAPHPTPSKSLVGQSAPVAPPRAPLLAPLPTTTQIVAQNAPSNFRKALEAQNALSVTL